MKHLAPLPFYKEYWVQQTPLNDTMRMQSTDSRTWHTARERTQPLQQINGVHGGGGQGRGTVRDQDTRETDNPSTIRGSGLELN